MIPKCEVCVQSFSLSPLGLLKKGHEKIRIETLNIILQDQKPVQESVAKHDDEFDKRTKMVRRGARVHQHETRGGVFDRITGATLCAHP